MRSSSVRRFAVDWSGRFQREDAAGHRCTHTRTCARVETIGGAIDTIDKFVQKVLKWVRGFPGWRGGKFGICFSTESFPFRIHVPDLGGARSVLTFNILKMCCEWHWPRGSAVGELPIRGASYHPLRGDED